MTNIHHQLPGISAQHLAAITIHKVQVTPRPGNSFQGPRQFRISIRGCSDRFPIVQKSLPLPRMPPPTELPLHHHNRLLTDISFLLLSTRVYCATQPQSPHPANISSQLQLRLPTPELSTQGHTFTVLSRQERCRPFEEK